MKKRLAYYALSAVAGLSLGAALFINSAQLSYQQAPNFARQAMKEFCDEAILAERYTVCNDIQFMDSNPETNSVYGQYLFRIYREDTLGSGVLFKVVYTEGNEVLGIR